MQKKGTSTFIMQRASAVLLLPFVGWFVYSVVAHAGDDYAGVSAWLSKPSTMVMLGGLVTLGAFHMRIGIMEVIEDYIHDGLRSVLNIVNWIVALGVVAAVWWALLSI